MAGGVGRGPPYAAVILILGLTEHPVLASYIRGKLALAGVDLSTDLATWLDSVYAVWIEAPHEALEKASSHMIKATARLRPEEARETWGMRPEHQAMAGRLGRGPGLEAGAGRAPTVGPRGDTESAVQEWALKQAARQRARNAGPVPRPRQV